MNTNKEALYCFALRYNDSDDEFNRSMHIRLLSIISFRLRLYGFAYKTTLRHAREVFPS